MWAASLWEKARFGRDLESARSYRQWEISLSPELWEAVEAVIPLMLQSVRLSVVMRMADYICDSVRRHWFRNHTIFVEEFYRFHDAKLTNYTGTSWYDAANGPRTGTK